MNAIKIDKRKTPEFKNNIKKRKETSERRKLLRPLAMELKIDSKWLNKKYDSERTNKNIINFMFYEGKLLYNDFIYRMETDLNIFDKSILKTLYKNKNIYKSIYDEKNSTFKNKKYIKEPYELKILPATLRLTIIESIQNSIRALSTKKKNGRGNEVGRLKYLSDFDTLVFRSADATGVNCDWWKKNNNGIVVKYCDGNYIKIPLLGKVKVHGIKQIPNGAEIRNYILTRRGSNYYIMLNTSLPYDEPKVTGEVGLDFGIKTAITTSDGKKYSAELSESNRLKALSRRMANIQLTNKEWRKSKHYRKLNIKLKNEYLSISNQRNENANQLMNELKKNYKTIVIQDENLKGWHKAKNKKGKKKKGYKFSRKVQYSILGRVKAKIKILSERGRGIIIDRCIASTKWCPKCKTMNDLTLNDRIFCCKKCGYSEDRDVKAAKTILAIGMNWIKYPKEKKKKE